MQNEPAIETIKRIISGDSGDKIHEIITVLSSSLRNEKIDGTSDLIFCSCGFPYGVKKNGNEIIIEEITNREVEFRSYKEFFYCPMCGKVILSVQY